MLVIPKSVPFPGRIVSGVKETPRGMRVAGEGIRGERAAPRELLDAAATHAAGSGCLKRQPKVLGPPGEMWLAEGRSVTAARAKEMGGGGK